MAKAGRVVKAEVSTTRRAEGGNGPGMQPANEGNAWFRRTDGELVQLPRHLREYYESKGYRCEE
jgi:hypothetical protein